MKDEERFEHDLRRLLYRFDCPSADTLRDYYWADLPLAQHRVVDRHLAYCPHCAAELRELVSVVGAEAARTGEPAGDRTDVIDRIRVIIARMMPPASESFALAGLRGESSQVLLFEADEVAVTLSIEPEGRDRLTLAGQALSPAPVDFAGSRVWLNRLESEPEPVEAALDRNGGFTLTNLLPGDYQLTVNMPDRKVVIPDLTLSV